MSSSFTPGRPHWWQWLTVLSLDAPLVAIAWQALFARVVGVSLAWHYPVLIGLAVWIVYAADRWIEGWRLDPSRVLTQRHHFYIRWRWPVFSVGVVAIVFTACLAFTRLDPRVFNASFLLLIPTLLYLFSHQLVHRHHPLRLPKELCIAVIFALGCALVPAVQAPDKIPALLVPTALFALLCFANCALIAAWEQEVDAQHGQTSLALQWTRGLAVIHSLPWVLTTTSLLLFIAIPNLVAPLTSASTALSGLLLGLLDRFHPRLGRQASRALIDLTLLTPLLLLAFH